METLKKYRITRAARFDEQLTVNVTVKGDAHSGPYVKYFSWARPTLPGWRLGFTSGKSPTGCRGQKLKISADNAESQSLADTLPRLRLKALMKNNYGTGFEVTWSYCVALLFHALGNAVGSRISGFRVRQASRGNECADRRWVVYLMIY